MNRRSFLIGGASGTALLGCRPWTKPHTPSNEPSEHELATLAAMADTFLPGDDGTPGAHEANALATIVDPTYGVRPYIAQVVSDLDDWCVVKYRRGFIGLEPTDRERALEERMGLHGRLIQSWYKPVYEGVLALTKLAFFGGIANPTGTNYVGFPGPSTGYAPASAAGAYASRDTPRRISAGNGSVIRVDGPGRVSAVRVTVFATSSDDVRATARVLSPSGQAHELALRADGGDILIDDVAVPLTGGAAQGEWRLEIARVGGGDGNVELWSLRLRTELDDA